jgi:hypothetical protein
MNHDDDQRSFKFVKWWIILAIVLGIIQFGFLNKPHYVSPDQDGPTDTVQDPP